MSQKWVQKTLNSMCSTTPYHRHFSPWCKHQTLQPKQKMDLVLLERRSALQPHVVSESQRRCAQSTGRPQLDASSPLNDPNPTIQSKVRRTQRIWASKKSTALKSVEIGQFCTTDRRKEVITSAQEGWPMSEWRRHSLVSCWGGSGRDNGLIWRQELLIM